MIFAFDVRRNVDLLFASFTMTRKNLSRESEVGKQRELLFWAIGR